MPRSTTKQELITAANAQFDKPFAMIDAMPEYEQTATFCFDAGAAGKEGNCAAGRHYHWTGQELVCL